MSELSYLEKLLDGVEVEWLALREVIHSLKTGLNPRQNFQLNTTDAQGYYVTVREIQGGKIVFLDKTDRVNHTALALINGRSNLEADDILFSGTGTVGRTAIVEGNPIDWNIKEGVYTIKPIKENIIPKFLLYLLNTSEIIKEYSKKIVGNPVMSLPMGDLKKLLIPIPCPNNPEKSLAIQSEIVRILDKFTAITAELTAELTMRKKQYNYYRDHLLSFKDAASEVEWKTLGEIGEFIRGKRFTKADYVEEGISVIHYGEIYTRYGVSATDALSKVRTDMAKSLRYAEPGDVILTDVGETVEDVGKAVAWLGDGKVAIHDHCYAFRHTMNPKFVSYCMQTASFIAEKAKYVARTKVNTLLINSFSKILIPVPYPNDPEKSLAEQTRIVNVLDNFDTLTSSISEGLPREIELRQKQYEYYRDLLFSFPKPETVA
ncbi:restriction endonuclease subunit S [Klebsiella quasipneumoniae]|uniref:restriction endonuclease subunit S n=1 Tax=Klebsiella quasipneumoniae TaxID=1463165 RepID=UPI0022E1FE3F|nr:restriction endonuclease subunit S [Klebsiella quasipneumoniae]